MKNADKKKLMDSKLKCLFLDAEASTSEPVNACVVIYIKYIHTLFP